MTLYRLNLRNANLHTEKRKTIEQQALYAFATREEMRKHNEEKLFNTHSEFNPVAKIKAITTTTRARQNHFDEIRGIPKILEICIGARVEIRGKNLMPTWGLFNSSVGTVIDVLFNEHQTPNNGDLPAYVLVDFNAYCGPVFLQDHPTFVPIVPITVKCEYNCCTRTQIPLALAFAKTIHTLQGLSIGPTKTDQRKNSIQYLVASIGSKTAETRWPGLTYVVCSRSTTIGTSNDPTTSALFFSGNDAIPKRFQDIHLNDSTKQPGKKWQNRNQWMQYLKSNEIRVEYNSKEAQNLIDWFQSTTEIIDQKNLTNIICMTYQ